MTIQSMGTVLDQKRRPWSRRTFTLLSDRIVIERRTLREHVKYDVRLDKLGFDMVYYSDDTRVGRLILYFCMVAPVVLTVASFIVPIAAKNLLMFWVFCLMLALINLAKEHSDDIRLTGGEVEVAFYRDMPAETEVREYIEEVIRMAKAYYRDKYTRMDPSIPDDIFLGRLHWLHHREIITDGDLEELRNTWQLKKLL